MIPNIQDFLTSQNEIVVLIILFALCFLATFIMGRGKTIAFILSFYPSIFLYTQFPLSDKLMVLKNTQVQIFLNKTGIFLIFFVIAFLIINSITGRSLIYTSRKKIVSLSVLGLLLWILILTTIFQVIESEFINTLLPYSKNIFTSQKLFFWLLSAPLIPILFFLRK